MDGHDVNFKHAHTLRSLLLSAHTCELFFAAPPQHASHVGGAVRGGVRGGVPGAVVGAVLVVVVRVVVVVGSVEHEAKLSAQRLHSASVVALEAHSSTAVDCDRIISNKQMKVTSNAMMVFIFVVVVVVAEVESKAI